MRAGSFFLGTHMPGWLADPRFAEVPLFVSRRRLVKRRTLPRAKGRWACDSGGFMELSLFGGWTVGPRQYAGEIRRFRDEIGGMAWAAPNDWMCEPGILRSTGLDVVEHQRRTVANLLELRSIAPDLPFVPVLQGWQVDDYLRCVDAYDRAGVNLRKEPVVGVGTVCRRQNTTEGARIVRKLAGLGLKLHGFGFKVTGLRACGDALVSADSLAWSFRARRSDPLPGHSHKSCANCPDFALAWRGEIEAGLVPRQLALF